jgi:hypothetical protein
VCCIFKIGFLELSAWGWLRTTIFLISASWAARITGVSHQHLASSKFLKINSIILVLCFEALCGNTGLGTSNEENSWAFLFSPVERLLSTYVFIYIQKISGLGVWLSGRVLP